MKILLAEDEKDLNNIIKKQLLLLKYNVDTCFDGVEAMDFIAVNDYDAVILDIMLPKADGYKVLKYIREVKKDMPVLFLTAKDSIEDRVRGLDMGANDYLVKPFAFDELAARIRAITRTNFHSEKDVLKVGDLELDVSKRLVKRADKEINLSTKEFDLLEYMMRNSEIILSREKIENYIWSYDYEGGTNLIDVYISYLRKKIDDGYEEKMIKTVRGVGYVLRAKA